MILDRFACTPSLFQMCEQDDLLLGHQVKFLNDSAHGGRAAEERDVEQHAHATNMNVPEAWTEIQPQAHARGADLTTSFG